MLGMNSTLGAQEVTPKTRTLRDYAAELRENLYNIEQQLAAHNDEMSSGNVPEVPKESPPNPASLMELLQLTVASTRRILDEIQVLRGLTGY